MLPFLRCACLKQCKLVASLALQLQYTEMKMDDLQYQAVCTMPDGQTMTDSSALLLAIWLLLWTWPVDETTIPDGH